MKRIHIRKPDIKGFFTKVRNLKKEDIKRHFKEKSAGSVYWKNGGTVSSRRKCSRSISG